MNFIKKWLLLHIYHRNAKDLNDYSGLTVSEAIELKKEYQKEVNVAEEMIDKMAKDEFVYGSSKWSNEILELLEKHKNKYKTKIAVLEKCFDLNRIKCGNRINP